MFIGYVLLAMPTTMNTGLSADRRRPGRHRPGHGPVQGQPAGPGRQPLRRSRSTAAMRDRAFNIFYMGINIGAMFAPTASKAMHQLDPGQGPTSSTTPASRPWPTSSSRASWPTRRPTWASPRPRTRPSPWTRWAAFSDDATSTP
ncbi:MAG: hypothetical protein MZV64_33625 [Ignavibacteriales bacterium]|nr:hypothetical protein [Ignavibacteriales bacterium]